MSLALTAPLAIAALVLCAAGVAKARVPGPAAAAARSALALPRAFPVEPAARVFGWCEIAVGVACLVHPDRVLAALIAAAYAAFAGIALRLARQAQACGCFGSATDAASPLQAVISATLALVAAIAVVHLPDGLAGTVSRAPGPGTVVVLAALAGAYAITVAYRELPRAWHAWSPR